MFTQPVLQMGPASSSSTVAPPVLKVVLRPSIESFSLPSKFCRIKVASSGDIKPWPAPTRNAQTYRMARELCSTMGIAPPAMMHTRPAISMDLMRNLLVSKPTSSMMGKPPIMPICMTYWIAVGLAAGNAAARSAIITDAMVLIWETSAMARIASLMVELFLDIANILSDVRF